MTTSGSVFRGWRLWAALGGALAVGCGDGPAAEDCTNHVDDDRDGAADCDDDACARHCDTDGDGYRDVGFRGGDDCDDANPNVHPAGAEVCNGIDDDCDALVDDADDAVDGTRRELFADLDGDGVGAETVLRCAPGPGVSDVGGDCDDADPARSPALPELCDGVDDDCDDLVDADDPSLVDLPTLFLDRDHDGHGDPGVAIAACPADGWASDALDCDDTRPDVHGLALEVCDGVDTNCDGATDPEELDADGDGDPVCTDCDDSDPQRSSRAEERCGADMVDEDCDGLVDEADPSLNPYTCGYCPVADPTLIDPMTLYQETWNPCVLDPLAEAMCSTDPAKPDTHTSGERLHRVIWRVDEGVWRDKLFLFIPPGPGRENNTLRTWAAYAGYRVVSIGYPNDDESRCNLGNADDCFRAVRYETTYGVDLSHLLEIGDHDSIVSRLSVLLQTLAVEHYGMGWDTYLLPDGTPDWSRIAVAGWSGGGGYAAFIPHYEPSAGVLLMSAPADYGAVGEAPADWISAPSATPGCATLATWHVAEPGGGPGEIFERAFDEMGVPDVTFDLDLNRLQIPPPGTTRITQSVDADTLDETCTAHGSVARDVCMRDEQMPAYVYLLCTLSDLDPDTCE